MKTNSEQKLDALMNKIIESTVTGTGGSGTGILTGDAWPDGIYVKAGRKKIISPSGLMRGMTQLDFPLADAIYDNDEESTRKLEWNTLSYW